MALENLQTNYTENPAIIRSYNYYMQLDPYAKELINAYKAEMDASDWADKPLDITYTVANWILYHKATPVRNMPNLIREQALTKEQFVDQVKHAKNLVSILEGFPKLEKNSLVVFRGENKRLGDYIKQKKTQTSLYSFLSTTVNLKVATAFNKGVILAIHIPAGNPLPFISDHLSPYYLNGQPSSESEILLPPGSTFQINGYTNVEVLGKPCDVIYLTLLRFGPHDTRTIWNRYRKNTNKLYNELYSRLYNSSNNMSVNTNNKMNTRRNRMIRGGNKKRNRSKKNTSKKF